MERARERAASIAILTSIPMVAQLVAGRAVRDTLFLTEYDASYLPRVMLAAAALSLVSALSVGRLMPRWGPRGTAVLLASVNGGIFILEAALIDVAPHIIAVVTYIHVSVVGALVVSAFSSVVNERFDPLYAKTVVARVGTGAALGGVVGGVVALVLSDAFTLATVLYGLGAISALVALGVWAVGKSTQRQRPSDGQTRFGIETIRRDPYLSRVALTVMLLGAVGVLVDYAMKAEADARYVDSAGLLSFFALFYMVTALLTFVMQAGVAKPLLQKIGLGGTMAVLPFAVALSAGLGAVWTRLWTAALARGSQTVLSSSLFRSGYELLYTPIPPLKKRGTKALIDIACNRIGYGIGSIVLMLILVAASTTAIATSWVLGFATIAALVAAWMVRQLQDGYVRELATSLRDGSITLQSDDIVDATTLHTLAETAAVLDRHELLKRIEALGHDGDDGSRQRDTWTAQLSDLLSDEPRRVLSVLTDESLSPRLAAPVIDLLGKDLYARPAYRALEGMSAQIMGQLIDAMLSTDSPVAIRRRIPRLLRKLEDPRAVRGLMEGLHDEQFDVRYRCGHALADLQRVNPDLDFPKPAIIDAVGRELALDQGQQQHRDLREGVYPEMRNEIDALLDARKDRSLQHVFTLLSLALDRDAVILSLRALSSQDENLRGTALEYLHNVLPDPIREPLWPRLTERSSRPPTQSTTAAPEDLLRSMQSLMLNRDQLEK
jgi:HEAT repeat protein/MFS family permease